jgi:Cu(I)/Ag(I) efflux system membrane fusion protein
VNIRLTRWTTFALCGTVALAAASVTSCDQPHRANATPPQPNTIAMLEHQGQGPDLLQLQPGALPDMSLFTVHAVRLPRVLETTGQIAFDDRRVANIISRVAGRIEDVRVSQWDFVRQGQPILTLYSPDFMTAEAEYLQAKAAAPALAGGSADERQFSQSMVEAARRKLELLGITPPQIRAITSAEPSFVMRAPISGTVVQNLALRGSAVNPGDVLYSLGTLDDVWITADIYEDELARIRVGQPLEAITTAYPAEVFRGTVERISPTLDPNTHTLQVRCRVSNPGRKLKPQMLAQVRIMVPGREALITPLDALVFETDAYFVYVDAGNDRFERRRVTIASWNEQGYARVAQGLKPGDRVVTGATMQVNELWHEVHGERS